MRLSNTENPMNDHGHGPGMRCPLCLIEELQARVAELEAMLNAALDDDWEQPDLAAYRVMRSGWKPE